MFSTIFVHRDRIGIKGSSQYLIFSKCAAYRARRRSLRNRVPRNPVVSTIDGEEYLFTKNEWKKGFEAGRIHHEKQIQRVKKALLAEQQMLSPKLSKQREERIRREADIHFYVNTSN
ncbi:hypothetical protein Dalk_1350 [Desulfatibacillum aliphaticivorans]|uniref:Uncharacterized protein n=1 Tax=Desulfatibacillum aliphaticivorans TaxID=218208 RepID=B8F9V5_DESAL|nr:hypothetical protein [Desulfatibacillum aliphaticivorans]ACL03051.1 hypothetical protein Dalk_1350 [Desulfatibacillum aliphaticivorans]